MIHITLPDGSVRTFEQEQITPLEVAKNKKASIPLGRMQKSVVPPKLAQTRSLSDCITASPVHCSQRKLRDGICTLRRKALPA